MRGEIWKPIADYENLYEVSSLGRVRSLDRFVRGRYKDQQNKIKGRVLKQHLKRDGYLNVGLWKNGKLKIVTAHRLAAKTFFDKVDYNYCVNHKDGNRSNNCLENLEWCTQSYNVTDGLRRRNGRGNASKLSDEQVKLIREMYFYKKNTGRPKTFSCKWLGKCFKVHESTIEYIVKGKTYKKIMSEGNDAHGTSSI